MAELDYDALHITTKATVALARSIHGESADHEEHDYYRKHVGVALDAVVPALVARVRDLYGQAYSELLSHNSSLHNRIADLEAERDAARSTIAKVRKVTASEKFDVHEAGFWVDGVIEVAKVLKAIDGPTKQETLQAEIDMHAEWEWDDDASMLVCSHCKSLWDESSDKCPKAIALGSVPSTGEGNE